MSSDLQTGKAHSQGSGNVLGEGISMDANAGNTCSAIPLVITPYGANASSDTAKQLGGGFYG